ncbi:DUF523 domain-containing protein [Clostridium sp. Marseille-P299]|uniref:DUF523 domain-containing protein n=1 Tax=Clostridium sp. Marseille-P299 TaxID=1805477 RepID=UPI0008314D84|nr:DUF523 domain-containing protein [Clostridium sp. Marseille-P299]
MNILVSACLLGVPCRYDGQSKINESIYKLNEHHTLIPICPEQLGGLSTPRDSSERVGDKIITNNSKDVSDAFYLGAKQALYIAQTCHCKIAILKEKSPSCGNKMIYDGTFSGHLIPGMGVCAELLMKHGIKVYGESELDLLAKELL